VEAEFNINAAAKSKDRVCYTFHVVRELWKILFIRGQRKIIARREE
jgi:hypothetical protein